VYLTVTYAGGIDTGIHIAYRIGHPGVHSEKVIGNSLRPEAKG